MTVYITFHDDRTLDRVFATWKSAADHIIANWRKQPGDGSTSITALGREQMERLARDWIAVEEVLP